MTYTVDFNEWMNPQAIAKEWQANDSGGVGPVRVFDINERHYSQRR